MGYSKVVKISDTKVKLVHQLNPDGTHYAEDITVEVDESVGPERLAHLTSQDGKIGYASVSFSAASEGAPQDVLFPEE